MMPIDKIVKIIRKELSISQETLARELNISFTTINRWENGKSFPSKLARMRLAEFCTKNGISKDVITELKRL